MTQNNMILFHLEKYGSITQRQAIEFYGIQRLAARISDLREEHCIKTEMQTGKNRFGKIVRFAEYRLVKK